MHPQIPSWLPDACPGVIESLEEILRSQEILKSDFKDPLVYSNVAQFIINNLAHKVGKIPIPQNQQLALHKTMVNNYGSLENFYNSRLHVSARGILNLLNSAIQALSQENLLVMMLCFRSILECVGQYYAFLKDIEDLKKPSDDFNKILDYLGSVMEIGVNSLGGTRVEWKKLRDDQNLAKYIEKRKIRYSADELKVNLESRSVMRGICKMDKKIKGVMGTYDILCEFAHPNIGMTLAFKYDAEPRIDSDGVVWIDNTIDSRAPLKLLETHSDLFIKIFSIINQSLLFFIQKSAAAEVQVRLLKDTIRKYVSYNLNNNPKLFSPYSLCPCQSGDKIKFCCGKKS